jgi:hypothetical protein
MEVSSQLHAPAALLQRKSRWYPLDRRLGGPQSRSGRGGEEDFNFTEVEVATQFKARAGSVRSKTGIAGSNPSRASIYEGVSKSFRTGRQERELEMVQLFATMYTCIAIS